MSTLGPLVAADESFHHQITDTFATVAQADRSWTEKVCAMAALRDVELDHAKVNVHGGAIALGHPIGASGARIFVTLLNALKTRNAKRGLATLCIGGGEANAVIVERM